MTPPTDARCPNCGGYPRTEAQLAWKAAHPRSQRRWYRNSDAAWHEVAPSLWRTLARALAFRAAAREP